MGQKIHPHGLRVGVHRKWNNTWFGLNGEWKNLFYYQKELELFFRHLFYYHSYMKISRTKRILLFDVKLFKYDLYRIFLFIFFYKLRTRKRKEFRAKYKNIKKIKLKYRNNLEKKKFKDFKRFRKIYLYM